MPDDIIDETADSSPASDASASADSSQATTQPANPADQQQQQQQQPRGFHEHPDWQRMVRSRHEDRALITALQRELQGIRQQGQPNGQQYMSPEERQKYDEAAAALEKVLAHNPKLARLLKMAEQAPEYERRFQAQDQSEARAARAQMTAATNHIKDLAAQSGLATDAANLRHVVRLVAGEAMGMEGGHARYNSGDLSLLTEAFEAVKPWFSQLRKPADQALAQTKTKTKQLPPPMRGAPAGAPAVKPPQPGKEREYERDMHKRALNMLLEG